ncbi:MAG: SUMF1/EgtB/PvdO family nonheme iron enzyme [Phycisphaerales bacterium]|nr:SUMF1/EgtB/PvdO family nonheme iron enzyme [Phycisphaerales bacterium]
MLRRTLLAAAVSLPLAASAQPLPDYGFDWITVGDPGNAAYDTTFMLGRPTGSVDYSFRIAASPLSNAQWIDFANALDTVATPQEQFWMELQASPAVRRNSGGVFEITPGREQFGARTNYMLAAMYANWMHNDRSPDRAAFDSGAYDMSLFVNNGGTWSSEGARSPDARFWIPSIDEHIKASYYDPDKHGPGEGGYWRFPHQSDEPPAYALPWEPGAQSNAGIEPPFTGEWRTEMPLGLYPETTSAYGLQDVSGGVLEWTDSPLMDVIASSRMAHQSAAGIGEFAPLFEDIDLLTYGSGSFIQGMGLRLATVVPSPGTLAPLLLLCLHHRRRRPCTTHDHGPHTPCLHGVMQRNDSDFLA